MPADTLSTGLIGHWLFEGDARDYSTCENHGRPHGVDFTTTGRSGKPGTAGNTVCHFSYLQSRKDFRAMSTHQVNCLDVKDFGAETLRIGDLTGDGAPDFLFTQSVYGTRSITCLTATDISGNILWQQGNPSRDNGRIYSDLPVQIYDWDGDGCNEVLYIRQAEYAELFDNDDSFYIERAKRYKGQALMVVLDGETGKEKDSVELPAPADDCILIADLTGRGRREDLVVKDRYWNMWGISHEGKELWHWAGSTGHYPAVADLDGDGKDEVFVGYALIDDQGDVLFDHEPAKGEHQDATYIVQLDDGSWRLLFGNGGIHCLDVDGNKLWHHPLKEAQHVVVGHFRSDSPIQVMAIDRGHRPKEITAHRSDWKEPATLICYDIDGNEIWRREQPDGSWNAAIVGLDWLGGNSFQSVLVYSRGPENPAVIYDGEGEVIDVFRMEYTADRTEEDRQSHFYVTRADLWGDSRDEVVFFGSRGACIYSNSRPLNIPTLYNNNLYQGM